MKLWKYQLVSKLPKEKSKKVVRLLSRYNATICPVDTNLVHSTKLVSNYFLSIII